MSGKKKIWGVLRLMMGWLMFWGFIDKLWGLGYATASDKSWLSGSSPTTGFLKFGTHGPLASFFQSLASSPLVDWLFMIGLLLIGVALLLGIGIRIAGYAGALMMALMFLAAVPPEHNILIDDHLINILIFILIAHSNAGHYFGFGRSWEQTKIVRQFPILK